MAAAVGHSHTTVRRIWNAFGLQPHRAEAFKLSSDPLFVDKVRDIVGLYLSPPTHALVLCVDEKAQIQALDREQPVLAMMPGMSERRTHNYVRHGTTSLFAALDIATGFVIGKRYKRHRAAEFTSSNKSTAVFPAGSTSISSWTTTLCTRPRRSRPGWRVGPTGIFTSRPPPGRGSIRSSAGPPNSPASKSSAAYTLSVVQLETDIRSFIDQHNADPKPFPWTKSADKSSLPGAV